MPAEKQNDTRPAPDVRVETPAVAEPPKKDMMGIERDDKNVRISFTPDGVVLICTIPIGHMPRPLVHGFVYELHEIVNEWFAERKKNKIIVRDEVSKFNFKQSVNKLFGK